MNLIGLLGEGYWPSAAHYEPECEGIRHKRKTKEGRGRGGRKAAGQKM